jgi:hypothetical protein
MVFKIVLKMAGDGFEDGWRGFRDEMVGDDRKMVGDGFEYGWRGFRDELVGDGSEMRWF